MPADLSAAIASSQAARETWDDITALARNEWICWVISVSKQETRAKHIRRAVQDLSRGKRRPCCWIGCIHRPDKKMSPSVQYVMKRKSKTKS